VFYPEATEEACTAAILLDVDPIGMVRGRGGKGGAEDQDVNDRPYVASSLLSVVLSRWFNSALGGRCERKPELGGGRRRLLHAYGASVLRQRGARASVGTAARVGLGETVHELAKAAARDVGALVQQHKVRFDLAERFARAYRHYRWPVESLRDIRVAPFHIMATEGGVHADKDHGWHMNAIGGFVSENHALLMRTPYHVVDLADPDSGRRRRPGGRT
jgi:hypothetical protein